MHESLTTTIENSLVFNAWILKRADVRTMATGVKALSIWMKETLRLRM